MILKRKRSESEFSFSSSSASFSSPPRPEHGIFEFGAMMDDSNNNNTSPLRRHASISLWAAAAATPSHLPSRTMKRVRDNRPSEDEVHQRTLQMLYAAAQKPQQQHQQQQEEQDQQPTAAIPPQTQQQQQQRSAQTSLHSFWKQLPAPRPGTAPPSMVSGDDRLLVVSSYEDCGGALGGVGGGAGAGNDDSVMDDC